jgi:hypothetical protein
MNDLRGKREVENKTETHKTDGWENQRQFFLSNRKKALDSSLGLVTYYPILYSIIFFSYSSTTRLAT